MNVSVADLLTWGDNVHVSVGGLALEVHAEDTLDFEDDIILFVAEIARLRLGDRLFSYGGPSDVVQTSLRNPTDTSTGDNILLSDFVTLLLTLALAVSDALNLTDSVTIGQGNLLGDSISLGDSVSIQVNSDIQISVSDGLALSDAIQTLYSSSLMGYLRDYLNDKS